MPEQGSWLLGAKAQDISHILAQRSDRIRLSGGAIMLLGIFLSLYQGGLLRRAGERNQGLSLHSSVLLIVIVPIVVLVLVLAIALLSFNATQQAAERLMRQQAGDQVLSLVASTLSGKIKRAGELLCRYGGEEFAIVLAHSSLEDACQLAESLRNSICELNIEHHSSDLGQLSISIGVTALIPLPESRLEDFFVNADSALYRAKKLGRNQVQSHSNEEV